MRWTRLMVLRFWRFLVQKSRAPQSDARERRTQAHRVLAAGSDPGEAKKQAKRLTVLKSENNFESIAREWHQNRQHTWVPKYAADVIKRMESDVFPKLGSRPIAEIGRASCRERVCLAV